MSIYGDLGLNVQPNLIIDKIYQSKAAMDDANIPGERDDGVFISRYAQISDGTTSVSNYNLTVWRKSNYGKYELFANYGMSYPNISINIDDFNYNKDGFIDGTIKEPAKNEIEINRDISQGSGNVQYNVSVSMEDIGNTGAKLYNAYEDYLTADGQFSLPSGYNDYFAANGEHSLPKGYNDYLTDGGASSLSLGYKNYLTNEGSYSISKGYTDYLTNGGDYSIPDNYDTYFNKTTGSIGTFDTWSNRFADTINAGIHTEGDKHYLYFPYQDGVIWKTSKIDLNDTLHIISSTIAIEDDGKTLAID